MFTVLISHPPILCVRTSINQSINHRICANLRIESRAGWGGATAPFCPLCPSRGDANVVDPYTPAKIRTNLICSEITVIDHIFAAGSSGPCSFSHAWTVSSKIDNIITCMYAMRIARKSHFNRTFFLGRTVVILCLMLLYTKT